MTRIDPVSAMSVAQHASSPAVRMQGISKTFGGVTALLDVDFELLRGEVHALLGGNGAGKSTMLKVLNGVHIPDSGSIHVGGKLLQSVSPEASREAGIAMIFQEMSLIPTLSVAQNVFLDRESKTRFGLIDDRRAQAEAQRLFDMLEVDIDPRASVASLGAGQRQLTEIVKAISMNAGVLVLDEPSSALSTQDVERLFSFLRRLKKDGCSIIYVSHRMDEITAIADRATILRDGRNVITAPLSQLPIETMIEHIVGKRSRGLSDISRSDTQIGKPLLEVVDVCGTHKPVHANLTVHRGEVIGLAGLLGSGRSSFARAVCGIDPIIQGEIRIDGNRTHVQRPADAIDAGMVLIPEDRLQQGVIASHSLTSNLSLPQVDRLSRFTWVSSQRANALADQQITALQIKTASREHAVSTLSGGNQQKVVIGKWLALEPDILFLDEPTSGIDIGSKSEIIQLIRDLAARGKAIIMISSELSELLTACDRIVVMADGRLVEDLPRSAFYSDSDHAGSADPTVELQAAEQVLQIRIQHAIAASHTSSNALNSRSSEQSVVPAARS